MLMIISSKPHSTKCSLTEMLAWLPPSNNSHLSDVFNLQLAVSLYRYVLHQVIGAQQTSTLGKV